MKKKWLALFLTVVGSLLLATFAFAALEAAPPDWVQTNTDGFGDPQNGIQPLEVFDGQMYAGTWNETSNGQVWRTADGWNWNEFTPTWITPHTAVFDAEVFGSHLYIGTDGPGVGEVWRTDGTTWSKVVDGGFGNVENKAVIALSVFSNALYAATGDNEVSGVEIWRSATGEYGSWEKVHGFGAEVSGTAADIVMDSYNGFLYLGLSRDGVAELWRTDDGISWTEVNLEGQGDNSHVSAMAEFNGDFYIGLRNTVAGGEVRRSTDGVNWTTVFAGGLGNVENGRPYGLFVFKERLYVVFSNLVTGAEVWASSDGDTWQLVVDGGWGDSANTFADYYDKGAAVFNDNLYIATLTNPTGGEVWLYLSNKAYLPMVLR